MTDVWSPKHILPMLPKDSENVYIDNETHGIRELAHHVNSINVRSGCPLASCFYTGKISSHSDMVHFYFCLSSSLYFPFFKIYFGEHSHQTVVTQSPTHVVKLGIFDSCRFEAF